MVSGDDSVYTRLGNWSDGGNHAFRRRCIADNSPAAGAGEITVSDGGLYVFYDHLAVCRCAVEAGFRQRVLRRPAARDLHGRRQQQLLLEDRRSPVATRPPRRGGEGCAGGPAFASDLLGLVTLEDGDSVWIEARPASAVYRPNDASFFGLYRL